MKKRLPILVGVALCLGTLGIWWPTLHNGFINYDDGDYVTANYHVRHGLTAETAAWAFKTTCLGNWHPLTWLSHALDCQCYGLSAPGHHLTSLLLHILNAGLLFFVLRGLTHALWRSLFVAAFFALHPLRVESVAWVAERKDVLSAFFGLWCLWAYTRYARTLENRAGHPWRYYILALVLYALGLMSKPMLVTLPFVFLLLDYWPLERLAPATSAGGKSPLQGLLLEKLPFFLLSAASSVVTFAAQVGAGNTAPLPAGFRISNAITACCAYIGKLFWPAQLAVIYPRPASYDSAQVVVASLLLVAVTALVLWRGRVRKYLTVGWFWFLVMLLPVSGVVAIGQHALADRYTYLPEIGLTIAVVWAAWELAQKRTASRITLLVAGGVALVSCALVTRNYLKEWKSSLTLFQHALRVTGDNPVACISLATHLASAHDYSRAETYCAKALQLAPQSAEAWNLMAVLLADAGKSTQALACASNAVKAKPGFAEAHFTCGTIWLDLARKPEAAAEFERALRFNPEHVPAHINLAALRTADGRLPEAIQHYTIALQLDPGQVAGHFNLANALVRDSRPAEAIPHYQEALRLDPSNSVVHCNFAQVLLEQQRTGGEAVAHFERALRLNPSLVQAHYGLAVALHQQGQSQLAITHLRRALEPNADFPAAEGELAWILATDPDRHLRDAPQAIAAAEQACQSTGHQDPRLLASLAAAYAEAGRMSDAIIVAERARDLALAGKHDATVQRADRLLEAFRAGKAFHETSGGGK